MLDKTVKQLRYIFITCIACTILIFIFDTLYTAKYIESVSNPALERWAIIITFAGIFISLKILHPKLTSKDKTSADIAIKKYASKYLLRLAFLILIFTFNIVCLYFTGVKNFMFLAFITIFALFLCAPNRQQIENEIKE